MTTEDHPLNNLREELTIALAESAKENAWPTASEWEAMAQSARENRAAREQRAVESFDLQDQARSLELGVAGQIRAQRSNAGLSQSELAAEVTRWGYDMHQTTVAKIEAGSRPLRLGELFAIAIALDVPWLSLVTLGDPNRGLPLGEDDPLVSMPVDQTERYLEQLEDSRAYALEELTETVRELAASYARIEARAYIAATFARAAPLNGDNESDNGAPA